ncbi:MAG: hypothetical protein ACRDOE_00580 [Streptosporangiaceae bacterium]
MSTSGRHELALGTDALDISLQRGVALVGSTGLAADAGHGHGIAARLVTTNYTVVAGDVLLVYSQTAGELVIALPAAAAEAGRLLAFYNVNPPGSYAVELAARAGDTVAAYGAAAATFVLPNSSALTLVSDGVSTWYPFAGLAIAEGVPQAVSASPDAGTDLATSRADHVHLGVVSLAATGGATVTAPHGAVSVGAPALDTSAADIQPVGSAAAAGGIGESADAGHQHVGVHSVTAGTGLSNSGTATDPVLNASAPVLGHAETHLAADTNITAAATWTTAVSLSLGAGRWHILAHLAYTAQTTYVIAARLEDTTNAVTLDSAPGGGELSLAAGASIALGTNYLVPTGGATIALQGISSSVGAQPVMRAALTTSGTGSNATGMAAVQIG